MFFKYMILFALLTHLIIELIRLVLLYISLKYYLNY